MIGNLSTPNWNPSSPPPSPCDRPSTMLKGHGQIVKRRAGAKAKIRNVYMAHAAVYILVHNLETLRGWTSLESLFFFFAWVHMLANWALCSEPLQCTTKCLAKCYYIGLIVVTKFESAFQLLHALQGRNIARMLVHSLHPPPNSPWVCGLHYTLVFCRHLILLPRLLLLPYWRYKCNGHTCSSCISALGEVGSGKWS